MNRPIARLDQINAVSGGETEIAAIGFDPDSTGTSAWS
jgi:hypothetical protein